MFCTRICCWRIGSFIFWDQRSLALVAGSSLTTQAGSPPPQWLLSWLWLVNMSIEKAPDVAYHTLNTVCLVLMLPQYVEWQWWKHVSVTTIHSSSTKYKEIQKVPWVDSEYWQVRFRNPFYFFSDTWLPPKKCDQLYGQPSKTSASCKKCHLKIISKNDYRNERFWMLHAFIGFLLFLGQPSPYSLQIADVHGT